MEHMTAKVSCFVRAIARSMADGIVSLWSEGSALCLDYPVQDGGAASQRTRRLAAGAGEAMQARYTLAEMEGLLWDHGFPVYEHLDAAGMTAGYFAKYNQAQPRHRMQAPEGVHDILAVRK